MSTTALAQIAEIEEQREREDWSATPAAEPSIAAAACDLQQGANAACLLAVGTADAFRGPGGCREAVADQHSSRACRRIQRVDVGAARRASATIVTAATGDFVGGA